MNEMLLFGAGASKEAGVPTAYGLTGEIANEFRQHPTLTRHAHVVSFVLGGLLFNRGIHGDDPLSSGINVEEFFNAIQLLADRSTLEATPFVGSWHSMVEEFDKVQPPTQHAFRLQEIIFKSVTEKIFASVPNSGSVFSASEIDKKLEDLINKRIEAAVNRRSTPISPSNSIGRGIGNFVIEIINKWTQNLKQARPSGLEFNQEFKKAIDQQPRPGEGRIFREVAELMIQMLAKFVFVADVNKVSYLAPVKSLVTSQPRLTIASLNYDNCVELFCDSVGIRYNTGIEEWSKSGTVDMKGDGILLLKLHGSIDWQSKDGRSQERPMPHKVITRVSPEEAQQGSYWPAVIFGHRNKLTADGPFLDLLRAFQRELANVDRLTVVGYSFSDVHINVYISHWLNNRSQRRLRIIDPSFGERPNDYTKELLGYAKSQVEVIKEPAGKALQTLFE